MFGVLARVKKLRDQKANVGVIEITDPFLATLDCEAMKKILIKIFDPKKEVTLNTDSSEHVVAAIISREGHPVIYIT